MKHALYFAAMCIILAACGGKPPPQSRWVDTLLIRPQHASRAIATVSIAVPLHIYASDGRTSLTADAATIYVNGTVYRRIPPRRIADVVSDGPGGYARIDGLSLRGLDLDRGCAPVSLAPGRHTLSTPAGSVTFAVGPISLHLTVEKPRAPTIVAVTDTSECTGRRYGTGFTGFRKIYGTRSPEISAGKLSWPEPSQSEAALYLPTIRSGSLRVQFEYRDRSASPARFSVDQLYGRGELGPDHRTVYLLPQAQQWKATRFTVSLKEAASGIRLHFYNAFPDVGGFAVRRFQVQPAVITSSAEAAWTYAQMSRVPASVVGTYSVFVGTEEDMALVFGADSSFSADIPTILLPPSKAQSPSYRDLLARARNVLLLASTKIGPIYIPRTGEYSVTPLVRGEMPVWFIADFRSGLLRQAGYSARITAGSGLLSGGVRGLTTRIAHLDPTRALWLAGVQAGYLAIRGGTGCGFIGLDEGASGEPSGGGINFKVRPTSVFLRKGWHRFVAHFRPPPSDCTLRVGDLLAASSYGTIGSVSAVRSNNFWTIASNGNKNGGLYFVLGQIPPGPYTLRPDILRVTGRSVRVELYANNLKRYIATAPPGNATRIHIPEDAGPIVLYVYLDADGGQAERSTLNSIHLSAPAPPRLDLVLHNESASSGTNVAARIDDYSNSSYEMSITRGRGAPAVVALDQLWATGWTLQGASSKRVPLDAYANAWFVARMPSQLSVRYRNPGVGVDAIRVSLASYFAIVAWLIYTTIRRVLR